MSPTIIACESGIEQVTVYARGAVVARRVTLPEALPDGAVDLCVTGITALAEAGSVRAICEGDREVSALAVRLALPEPQARQGSLAERIRAIDLDRARIEAERASHAELRDALAELRLDPGLSRWAKHLDPAARFADAAAISTLVGAEIARIDAALRDLDAALIDNQRAREGAAIDAAQAAPDATLGEDRARLEVRVGLAAGAGSLTALAIEYVVRAARWWPAYSARFTASATKVALAIDALVAQATGEDWSRVRLALSTAHLAHDARLPELSSLRLGRAQPAPKRGYRPPPEGLAVLFEGYDRAFAESEAGRVADLRTVTISKAKADVSRRQAPADHGIAYDDLVAEASSSMQAPAAPGAGAFAAREETASITRAGSYAGPLPPMQALAKPTAAQQTIKVELAAPMEKRRAMSMPMARAKSAGLFSALGGGGGGEVSFDDEIEADEGGAAFARREPAAIEPADAWLDFDALVLADPADKRARGRLVRDAGRGAGPSADRARARIDAIAEPPMARDPMASRGRFDHRYDAEGTADVPSTGRPHRVAVGAADASATPCFVAVPREAAEVYREAEIKNPFEAPLLAGPVDVFLDGALMTTSEMAHVDRNGSMRIGLGVEDRLRVARNARVDESTAGLLGGSLVVDHAVTIDLASSLGRKVKVDVIERIPVTDDKDVEVKRTYARPEPEKYTQIERAHPLRRGLRFTVEVPAGEKAKVELGYRVTLPAKNEIVGGNRRE